MQHDVSSTIWTEHMYIYKNDNMEVHLDLDWAVTHSLGYNVSFYWEIGQDREVGQGREVS